MEGFFNVLMVGRYGRGEAAGRADRRLRQVPPCPGAQVILAGKGPLEKKYRRLAEKLPNPIVMDFYQPERLLELLHMADLYVHTSDAEIEAMSCMEAFACGLVPVIADSPRSATPQFALDGRSLFPRRGHGRPWRSGSTGGSSTRTSGGRWSAARRARLGILPGKLHPPDGGDVPPGHRRAAGHKGMSTGEYRAAARRCRRFVLSARRRGVDGIGPGVRPGPGRLFPPLPGRGLCEGCGTPGDGPAAPQQGHRAPPLTPAAAPSHILK